jgi:hypothetical protein
MGASVRWGNATVPGSSDEDGECLAMSLVVSKPVADVPEGSIVILPLTPPSEG